MQPPSREVRPWGPIFKKQIVRGLLAQLASPLNLEHIASHLNIDESALIKHFEKALGLSPAQWCYIYRLALAIEVLYQHGATSLSEVALACGFSDLRMFYRHFRRIFGLAPRSLYSRVKLGKVNSLPPRLLEFHQETFALHRKAYRRVAQILRRKAIPSLLR